MLQFVNSIWLLVDCSASVTQNLGDEFQPIQSSMRRNIQMTSLGLKSSVLKKPFKVQKTVTKTAIIGLCLNVEAIWEGLGIWISAQSAATLTTATLNDTTWRVTLDLFIPSLITPSSSSILKSFDHRLWDVMFWNNRTFYTFYSAYHTDRHTR